MSSQNTVLLQTIFADGVSDTLSDIFVELVKYREKSRVFLVFSYKERTDFSNDRDSSASNLR